MKHRMVDNLDPVSLRRITDSTGPVQVHDSESSERMMFMHSDVHVPPGTAALLEEALDSLPSGAVVIARVFMHERPHQVLNGGYWQGHADPLWRSFSFGETWNECGHPVLEPAHRVALGAMLMSRETAERMGPIDPRFATHLADVDWLNRAHRLGVPCYVVRNAQALADPGIYPSQLGGRYAVVRDGLLLARKHSSFWPWHVIRLLFWMVSDVWRPFDFSLSGQSGTNPLKRLVWAITGHVRGMRKRFSDAESKATLAAVRDFLFNRYERAS